MKSYFIGSIHGSGRTKTEAREAAESAAARAIRLLEIGPEVLPLPHPSPVAAVLVFPYYSGWSYRLIGPNGNKHSFTTGFENYHHTIRSAIEHAGSILLDGREETLGAAVAWADGLSAEWQTVWSMQRGSIVREWTTKTHFQAAYNKAREKGMTDSEAHDFALTTIA